MKMTRPNTQRGRPVNATATAPADPAYAFGYPADSSYYVVLPPAPYDPAVGRRRRFLGYGALFIFAAIFICLAIYFFWPSQPNMEVVRLNLQNIAFQTADNPGSIIPHLYMNISMGMTIKVINRDYFVLDYDYLRVGIGYRGRTIGVVNSQSGSLSARGTSYVDATLDLDGIEVLNDVFYLLRDLDRGRLPLDTTTEFDGRVRVWSVNFTLKPRDFVVFSALRASKPSHCLQLATSNSRSVASFLILPIGFVAFSCRFWLLNHSLSKTTTCTVALDGA